MRQAQLKNRTVTQVPATANAAAVTQLTAPLQQTPSEPPQWAQMMMMMIGGAFANNQGQHGYDHRDRRSHRSSSNTPSPPLRHSTLPLKRSAAGPAISYPELQHWLAELEANPTRNKHGEPFTKFADALVNTHKLFTIDDIVSLTATELAQVGNMEFGTASRLIRFARDDVVGLEKSKRSCL
jgi:hypothetical protein